MSVHDSEEPVETMGMDDQRGYEVEEDVAKLEESKKEDVKTDEGIGLEDVGKGLMLLGGIILIGYLVLLLISVMVQVEPGQMVWAMPGYLVPTIVISLLLLFAGLIIVAITREDEGI